MPHPVTNAMPQAPLTSGTATHSQKIAPQVRRNVMLLAAIIALGPFAIDAYLPAIPAIAQAFNVSVSRAESSVSVFLLFFALGQLAGGPMADRRGRRIVCLVGISGFAVSTLLLVSSQEFMQFMVLRGIQAFAGGLAIVACFSVTRDAFSGRELSRFVSLITSIMLVAPIIAPFVGTAVLLVLNWRWIFGLMAVYSLLLLGWGWFKLGETLPPDNNPGSIRSSYMRVLGHRPSLILLLLAGFSMTVMFTFLTSSSSTYQEFFGVSALVYALLFGTNVIAVLLLTSLNIFFLRHLSMQQLMGIGLGLQFAASLGLIVHSQLDAPLWLFVCLCVPAVGCMGIVLPNSLSMLLTLHPRDAGTCNALGGLMRFAMGGILGAVPTLFSSPNFAPMAITMSILALLGLSCWRLLPRESGADLGYG